MQEKLQVQEKVRILVAGATGYLGQHFVKVLQQMDADFVTIGRSKHRLDALGLTAKQIIEAKVTEPKSLEGCCKNIDVVISCIGITRQQDGFNYMDVDYQANINLLEQAERAGVKSFIYISAFNAPQFGAVRLLYAKEEFAKRLLSSSLLQPCVIRPNGFYRDMDAFYEMAKTGRSYLIGKGEVRLNPIHGEDLAHYCLAQIAPLLAGETQSELSIGGGEVVSLKQLVQLAYQALDKPVRITYLPEFIGSIALMIAKKLPERWGGAAEFFLTVSQQDMVAPQCGKHNLLSHFISLSNRHSSEG